MMIRKIEKEFDLISENFSKIKMLAPLISEIAGIWTHALEGGNKVIFCGNGGSAADSQHLAAELMGRYKIDRNPLCAISLTTDTSALTAIANDYGYENVFSRQLRGLGNRGDVLVGISTSGNSVNVIEAFYVAKKMGIFTVAFTGEGGGRMKEVADLSLCVPSHLTNNIQEMHIASGHIICGIVESNIFQRVSNKNDNNANTL